jgi:hypothetical protein
MKKIILSLVVLSSLVGTYAQAAVVRLQNPAQLVQVGDTLTVMVVLDTQGESINAASAKVTYTNDVVAFKRILDGDSVINFWVENPRVTSDGAILFSGITPGGFIGSDITLLTVQFEVIKEGVATFSVSDEELLLHDGLGTAAQTTSIPLSLNVLGQLSAPSSDTSYIDTEPPEVFSPTITTDKDMFEGNAFLVFQTEDKGSGIDFYEVKEGEFGVYQNATSPYELEDHSLSKKIFVRAVDRDGNEYIAELYPQSFVPWYETTFTKTVILIVCITALLFLLRRLLLKFA